MSCLKAMQKVYRRLNEEEFTFLEQGELAMGVRGTRAHRWQWIEPYVEDYDGKQWTPSVGNVIAEVVQY